FANTTEFFGPRRLLALPVVRQTAVIRLVRGQIEVTYSFIGVEQILEHAEQELERIRIGRAKLVVAVGERAQRGILRMLQDERDVPRTVEKRNELDMMPQPVVGQLLILDGRHCLRLDQR